MRRIGIDDRSLSFPTGAIARIRGATQSLLLSLSCKFVA